MERDYVADYYSGLIRQALSQGDADEAQSCLRRWSAHSTPRMQAADEKKAPGIDEASFHDYLTSLTTQLVDSRLGGDCESPCDGDEPDDELSLAEERRMIALELVYRNDAGVDAGGAVQQATILEAYLRDGTAPR